jgi:DNA-binding transcriptional LysR family regulator
MQQEMTHRQVEAFQAVIHTGSFTKAARMLRTSQPSVSRLLKELQAIVGFQLFSRIDGHTVPTPEAAALAQEVERSFVGLHRISERAAQIRDEHIEVLRIVSMPALAYSFVPAALASFLRTRSGVSATLQTQRSETIAAWLSNEQYDVGFAMIPIEKPGVVVEMFDTAAGVCVMPRDHPLARKDVITPADLDGQPFIGKGADSFIQGSVAHVLRQANVHCDVRIETPIAATACELVLEGFGVTISDPFTARAFQARGLVARPFLPEIPYNFGVLYPAHSRRSQTVMDFVAHVEEERRRFRAADA